MESNSINIICGNWCIRIYREGGYSVSHRIAWQESHLWVDACDNHNGIPESLVNDAKECYRALLGREMHW